MSFSEPGFLYLLLLIIPFLLFGILDIIRRKRLLSSFISVNAYSKLGSRSGKEIDSFKLILSALIIFFLILAMAGPQWGDKIVNLDLKSTEVLFVLDTSYSMNARDLHPDRISVAREMIKSIVGKIKSDYIGLVTYAATSSVQCPMTVDYEVFKLLTDASVISPPENQGTDFYEAFKKTLTSFHLPDSSEKAVFFISDGEDQEKRWESLLPELKKKRIVVFTIGVGSSSGAPIPLFDAKGKITGWKKDLQGNVVRTRLNEDALKKIAAATGGVYFRISDAGGIQSMVDRLEKFERSILKKKVRSEKISRFRYPLLFGIMIFLVEFFLTSKKIEWKKK